MKPDTITVGALRMHLKVFPDDWELFFGNGNLHFYRTKARGENLVQIEFDQHTDLITEDEWIPVDREKPEPSATVALLCRQQNGGTLQMTGAYVDGKWSVLGNSPQLGLVAVTHWCYFPLLVPECAAGDMLR